MSRTGLAFRAGFGSLSGMSDKDDRAKRLAEELRKNLRRRKGQAREQEKGGETGKS